MKQLVAFAICLTIVHADSVLGQSFPNKLIRIVTSAVGGSTDFTARIIAQELSALWAQPVIVDNRPNGLIPGDIVAKSTPDGYTLLVAATSMWVGPLLQRRPYDPLRVFAPITLTSWQPNILVVHPSLPVKSVSQLISLAKAKPGELNYASGGVGTAQHLGVELMKMMAGISIVRIPYVGTGAVLSGILSGQVQLTLGSAPPMMPHIKSGRLRAIAVTSVRPTPLAPGLPTVAASALPGYESVSVVAMFAPAGTPAAIIGRVNEHVAKALTKSEIKAKFFEAGSEITASGPDALSATVQSDIAKWGKVIKAIGITAD